MKTKSKFGNLFTRLFIAFVLLAVSPELMAQEQQSADLKDFKIRFEMTDNGIQIESLKGSARINLSFNLSGDKPNAFDEYGMTKLDDVATKKDPNLADCLITIAKAENGIILKGIEGTAWTELSFSLTENGKQTIDQFGMTE